MSCRPPERRTRESSLGSTGMGCRTLDVSSVAAAPARLVRQPASGGRIPHHRADRYVVALGPGRTSGRTCDDEPSMAAALERLSARMRAAAGRAMTSVGRRVKTGRRDLDCRDVLADVRPRPRLSSAVRQRDSAQLLMAPDGSASRRVRRVFRLHCPDHTRVT